MVFESGNNTAKKKKSQVLGDVTVTEKFNPYLEQYVGNLIDGIIKNPDKVLKESIAKASTSETDSEKATEEKEPGLLEKVYIGSAKKKQAAGESLNVPEITTMAKYGIEVDEVKKPKNISQAINYKRESDYKNLEKFEKAVRQSEDFYSVLSKEKTKTKGKKNLLEKFIDDYDTDKSDEKSKGDSTVLNGDGIFKYLLSNEKQIYRYLVNKGDAKKAREYINAKKPTLETRKAEDVASDRKGISGVIKNTGDAFATGVQTGLVNMARMGVAGNIAAGKNTGVLNELLQPTYPEKLYNEIREQHGNKNKIYGIVLDVANNIGVQTPQIAFSAAGGTGAYLAAMSQQIIGGDTTEAINNGYDGIRGIIYGAFDTALEYGTEYLLGGIASKINGGETSILVKKTLGAVDKAVSNKKVANALSKIIVTVSGANAEGTEEFLQTLIEPVLKNVIYGENNQYSADTFAEAVNAYIVGAISGGIMSIRHTGSNLANTKLDITGDFIKKNSSVNAVLSLSEVVGNKSEIYEQIKSENEANRDISNTELAELFYQSAEMFKNPSKEIVESFASKNVDKLIELAKESKLNDTEPTSTDVNTSGAETETELAEAETQGTDAELTETEAGLATDTDINTTESTADTNVADSESVFTERSAQKPEYDMLADGLNYGTDRVRLSEDQLKIASTGRALGHKVIFENTQKTQGVKSDGYIEADGTIHIDYNCKNPTEFVLKHELTHFGEGTEEYKSFAEEVKNSKAYEQWINKEVDGEESTAVKSAKYRKQITDNYAANGVKLTPTQAEAELIANFTGDVLFKADGSGLEAIMSDMSDSRRSKFVNFFKSFISYLKAKLTRNKTITAEVLKLERLFNETLSAAEQNNNTATEGDVKHSFGGEKARTSDKTLLESAKERIENGEDSETVRQETGWFKGYDGKWRFEISDREAELNDKPDFKVKGDNSLGFYRVAPLDEVLKHEDLFKAYPELKDYTVIVQETNPGTSGAFFERDNQIVLSNTLFRKESEKYKNSVNEKYEEIRKIEQSPEFKEYKKFYDDPELAKIDAEQWLVLEKEAEKKFYSSEIGKKYYKLKWGKSEVPRYELGWNDEAKAVLMHEIQHAVQEIEDFARGSSQEYWGDKLLKDAYKKRTQAKERLFESKSDSDLAEIVYLYEEYVDRIARNGNPTKSELAKAYDKFEKEIIGEEAQERFFDFSEAVENYYQLKSEISTKSGAMYRRTAGEREARDVEHRLNLTDEERKNTRPDIDRTDVVFADGSIYSASEYTEKFSEQIDDWLQGKMPKGNYFDLGITSPALVKSGAQKLPLVMPENVIYKFTTDYNDHSISLDDIKRLPYELQDPVFTFKGSVDNSIVALTEITDKSGNEVIAAIHLSKRQGRYIVNRIASVYGKNNIKNYVLSQIENGNLIEPSAKKALNWFTTKGLQLPEVVQTKLNASSVNNISQSDTVVKNNISENAENYSENISETDSEGNKLSQEQQKYFADSKVRSKDGELLVMYHGTKTENGDFYVFDSSKAVKKGGLGLKALGKGNYFTSKKLDGTERFGSRVIEAYLNITNPFVYDGANGDIVSLAQQVEKDTGVSTEGMTADELQNKMRELGYDGIIEYRRDGSLGIAVTFDSEQIKEIGNTSPTSNPDIRYSIPDRQSELLKKYDNGEITREEYLEESNKNWEEAVNNYGTFKEGENAKEKIPVPKAVREGKNTAQFVKTVIESGHLSSRMIEDMGAEMLEGGFEYTPVTDEQAQTAADKAIKNGEAEAIWKNAVKASRLLNKDSIAVGEKLLMQAIKAKDTQRVVELTAELSDVLVRNGQNVQAASMFKKMTGAGKLVTIQRFVDKLNSDRLKKYGDTTGVVKLDEHIAEQIAESAPGEDISGLYNDALRDIASQTEATFLDKWNAWRYMSMLTNPTTHIRNIVGNAVFTPSVRMKDFTGAVLENMFVEESERTKVIKTQKKYRDFAEKDAAGVDVKNALANGGHYSEASISQEISEYQRVFKTKWLEFVRKGNSNLLEAEDAFFKNIHYKHALAGFLQARGTDLNNVTEKTLWEARAYAMDEALKATFNDSNSIATILNNAAKGNKYVDIAINGILPFKKTPVNIVRRGVEYSPIGLLSTLTKGTYDLKKGKISATEYIDGMGAGISGTAVFAVGMLLASLGVVTGSFGDSDEDDFRKLNGEQEYALQIGGKSYTIDWAAPACIPFFIGVELMNEMRKEKEDFSVADVSDVMWNSFEPILELSMLSGVQSMIESVKYADNGRDLIALAGNVTKSYFSQGLPTVGGKLARTVDSKRRSNYIDKNSKLSEFSQGVVNTVKAKVPILENTRPEYVDEWGQTESNGNIAKRIFENFFSPGYASSYGYDKLSEELLRISNTDEVKNDSDLKVFPQYAQKSFTVNGETKYLTADEYVKYAEAKGKYSREYIEEFLNGKEYKKLTDEERAYVITELYKYANAKAKTEVSDYDISSIGTYKKPYNWEKGGKPIYRYYVGKALSRIKEEK